MSWCSDAPEDEAISLFAGLLANPDMTLSLEQRSPNAERFRFCCVAPQLIRRSVASLSRSPPDLGACAYRPVSPEKHENRGNRRLEQRRPNAGRFQFCCVAPQLIRRSVASLSRSPADLGACAYRPVSPEKHENRGNRRLEQRRPNAGRFHFCCVLRVSIRRSVASLSRSPADLGACTYRPVSSEKHGNRGNRRLEQRRPNAGRFRHYLSQNIEFRKSMGVASRESEDVNSIYWLSSSSPSYVFFP
jgi:hypothetical protein